MRQDSVDDSRIKSMLRVALTVFLAFLTVGCLASATAQEASTPPNIIFILTDDQDAASVERMPAVSSRIMGEGATFENAFAAYPLCCPSRATAFTGLYPHNHRVLSNREGEQRFRAAGNEGRSVALALDEAGYRTGLFGKYLNGYAGRRIPPGWDEWHSAVGTGVGKEYYRYTLNENGRLVDYGSAERAYFTDVISKKARTFVRESSASGEPFFAFVAPPAPHNPATPARRHEGMFSGERAPRTAAFNEQDVSDKPPWLRGRERLSARDKHEVDATHRRRLASLIAVDEMVAGLLDELQARTELKNTYVFYTSDNG